MSLYSLARPLLKFIPPEKAHRAAICYLKKSCVQNSSVRIYKSLKQNLWGMDFNNPIGLAAGFDKDAEALEGLLNRGFGFVEAGTVTPKPQIGNPKPRVFRDFDNQAVINAMGFPGQGIAPFKKSVEKFRRDVTTALGPIGINIGKNKMTEDAISDYMICLRELVHLASYITVNVSSPNTPGLRDLQSRDYLMPLLKALIEERDNLAPHVPIWVKIAPDLDQKQQEELAQTLIDVKIDGIVVSNTTISRPENVSKEFANNNGGLSGKPLFEASTEILKNMYKMTGGKIPLIGVGGVSSGQDAYTKIKSGASLVQLYTALIFQGPELVENIVNELAVLLKNDGLDNISQAIGVDVQL